MNLRRLDLNLLPVLEALFIERNLTRAAERVGLSQPAMSNALARLRAAMDDELFVRQGRTMQPTPKARQIAAATQDALATIREGLMAPPEFDRSQKRTFQLAGTEHVEFLIMPLMALQLGHDIETVRLKALKARNDDYVALLKSGEADMIVDYQAPEDPELKTEKLVDDRLICLVRADHPFEGAEMTPEAYAEFRHVVPDIAVNRFFLDVFLRSKGVSRDIVARMPTVISMPLVVENSDLICTMSELLADVITRPGDFRRYEAPLPDPSFPLFMVWHHTRDSDPAHIWLREFVRESCVGFKDKISMTEHSPS